MRHRPVGQVDPVDLAAVEVKHGPIRHRGVKPQAGAGRIPVEGELLPEIGRPGRRRNGSVGRRSREVGLESVADLQVGAHFLELGIGEFAPVDQQLRDVPHESSVHIGGVTADNNRVRSERSATIQHRRLQSAIHPDLEAATGNLAANCHDLELGGGDRGDRSGAAQSGAVVVTFLEGELSVLELDGREGMAQPREVSVPEVGAVAVRDPSVHLRFGRPHHRDVDKAGGRADPGRE